MWGKEIRPHIAGVRTPNDEEVSAESNAERNGANSTYLLRHRALHAIGQDCDRAMYELQKNIVGTIPCTR